MKTLIALATLLLPLTTHAALFDAADILPENSGAVGAFGELLLSDPTSEGLEARGRYGLSDDWNVAAILGTGSKGKQFRFGGEAVYSILPDWEGQVGLSAIGSALYIERFNSGGVQLRVGVMGHKKVNGWAGLPATIYLGLPFYFEGRRGTYNTGAQIVFGSLMDLNETSRYYLGAEGGVKVGNSDSYILLGLGMRFGDLKFAKREKGPTATKKPGEREYKDADFE